MANACIGLMAAAGALIAFKNTGIINLELQPIRLMGKFDKLARFDFAQGDLAHRAIILLGRGQCHLRVHTGGGAAGR